MSEAEDFDNLFDEQPDATPTPAQPSDDDAKMREFYQSREGQRRIRMGATGRGHEVAEKDFYMPVGPAFLSKVLRLNPETVARRLRTVSPVGHAGGSQNRPLYDFATVVGFLVKPKMDIRTYLRSLNPADMPTSISKVFWEAERIRNKTLLETGEAWPTEAVLEVMSQGWKMVADRIPLIIEGMREEGLTDDQMKVLETVCDQFRTDLHEALVDLPRKQTTPSRLAEVGIGVEDGETGE